jgi:hypothetical protein
MTRECSKKRARFVIYVLPVAHLCLCAVALTFGFENWNWMVLLIVVDWPISCLLSQWKSVVPLLIILGTAWWALLGWVIYRLVNTVLRRRACTKPIRWGTD